MNIGLIYTGYGTKDLVDKSLEPWVNLRAQWMGQFDRRSSIRICAVSVKFAGFDGEDDGTTDLLRDHLTMGDIDHLIDGPQNVPETTARGMGLRWLKEQGVDTVIQWDADEVADEESISRMLSFIESDPFTQWFRFAYRNLVFDEKTWLAEPFCPPRVHRVNAQDGYTAHSFSSDNDICYGHPMLRNLKPQEAYASRVVPPEIFNPKHFSWLNNERSRKKIDYQLRGRGWPQCSFAWDDSKGGLIFNPNLPEPKVIRE